MYLESVRRAEHLVALDAAVDVAERMGMVQSVRRVRRVQSRMSRMNSAQQRVQVRRQKMVRQQLGVQVREGVVRMGRQEAALEVQRRVQDRRAGRRRMGADGRGLPVRGRVLQVRGGWVGPEEGRHAETVAGLLRGMRHGRGRDADRRRRRGRRRPRRARGALVLVLVADLLDIHVDLLLADVDVHLGVPALGRGRVRAGGL